MPMPMPQPQDMPMPPQQPSPQQPVPQPQPVKVEAPQVPEAPARGSTPAADATGLPSTSSSPKPALKMGKWDSGAGEWMGLSGSLLGFARQFVWILWSGCQESHGIVTYSGVRDRFELELAGDC